MVPQKLIQRLDCGDGIAFRILDSTVSVDLTGTPVHVVYEWLAINASKACLHNGPKWPAKLITLSKAAELLDQANALRTAKGLPPIELRPVTRNLIRHARDFPTSQHPFNPELAMAWPGSPSVDEHARQTLWLLENGDYWLQTDDTVEGLPASQAATNVPALRFVRLEAQEGLRWLSLEPMARVPMPPAWFLEQLEKRPKPWTPPKAKKKKPKS